MTGTLETTIGITDWMEFTPGVGFSGTRFFDEDGDRVNTQARLVSIFTGVQIRLLDRAQAPVGVAFTIR